MVSGSSGDRVAVVFRGADRDAAPSPRLDAVRIALAEQGLSVVPVPYVEGRPQETAAGLSDADGALVWVDPLGDEGDRAALDEVLREAARGGLWVSAHPDVVDLLGTKEVLVTTRDLSWGSDVHLYRSAEELRSAFPGRLAAHGVRVLKASRGNGGRTVWKVRLADDPAAAGVGPDTRVVVQRARVRDGSSTVMPLGELMDECLSAARAWHGHARMIDQEFVAGITRGIVRCYLVGTAVVGFARQYPEGVRPVDPLHVDAATDPAPEDVMGLPSPKTMYPPDEPALADLRRRLETEWVPEMVTLLGLRADELPALWDIDLIPDDADGGSRRPIRSRFVLCEINASSVIPFPPEAPPRIAAQVVRALDRRRLHHAHP